MRFSRSSGQIVREGSWESRRPRLHAPLILGLLISAGTSAATGAEPAPPFRAGAATSNITPPLGSSINGGMRDRPAEEIHDELHARCLVLDDGRTRLAFVTCDSCMIPREVVEQAKGQIREHTGIEPDHVLISATHAHSAPTATAVFQSEVVEGYPAFLAGRIADGVRRAVHNLEPARIGWGVGRNADHVFNRRWRMRPGSIPPDPFGQNTDQVKMNPPPGSPNLLEPAGPIDPDVSIISIRASGGRPIALLANYSLHYVGGTGSGHVSADYYGVFAERVRERLASEAPDPPFVSIMTNGTSGDINNVNFRAPRSQAEPYEQIGRVAGDLAAEAVRVAESIAYRDSARLDARTTTLRLGVRRPDPAALARAEDLLGKAEGPDYKTPDLIYAREARLLDAYPAEVPVTVQALRIGDLGIVAIPCEVFVEIGLDLKARSPFRPTFTIELANGYNGYLPTEAQHALGGYETWRARSSYLETGAASKLTEAALELLTALNAARSPD